MNSKTKFLAKYKTFLLSTGVLSLDCLLNGGIPTSTLTLFEEDINNIHCSLLCQHFVSCGLYSCQDTALVIDEISPESYIENLPKVNISGYENQKATSDSSELNIAWRYKDVKSIKDDFSNAENSDPVESFNLSKFSCQVIDKDSLSENLSDVLNFVKRFIKEKAGIRKPLRLVISSLGSPLWGICKSNENFVNLIYRFLFCLKSLISDSTISVIVTINPELFEEIKELNSVELIRTICHYVFKFEAFEDPKAVADQLHNDVTGQIKPIKIPCINSLEPIVRPNTIIWSYHVRRKKMLVKEFCLPPCLSDNTSRTNQNESSRIINMTNNCGVDF